MHSDGLSVGLALPDNWDVHSVILLEQLLLLLFKLAKGTQ